MEETLECDYAAKVSIWEDTGHPVSVIFGNNWGRPIPEGMDWRNDTTIESIPYQAAALVPLYDINNPDPNQEPVNKAELIQKGYVEDSDGRWTKTTPDVPPHKRTQ